MKKNIDNIEALIEKNDELYYWAADYCKAHRCNVKTFYFNNKSEVDKKLKEKIVNGD